MSLKGDLMGKIQATIEKNDGSYIIELHKQLMDHLGLKEGDEVEFELKKVFQFEKEALDTSRDVQIKITPTCFKYGVATLSTEDRKLFPQDRHPFLMEIDGKIKTKHVASLKIAMKDFFDRHSELEEKEYITIKIVKPFEEYKLIY